MANFKAINPLTGKIVYFVEKCLPFGASISCSHFQRFSNALRYILQYRTAKTWVAVNYLDDFLFVKGTKAECNRMVSSFLNICSEIGVPIAQEKTEWARVKIVFLGILLDGRRKVLSLPQEKIIKIIKARNWLKLLSCTEKKKATVQQLQSLAGFLNFLNRAIFPSRAFTRCMYAKWSGSFKTLKPYHHIRLNGEFKRDCSVWLTFLGDNMIEVVAHPFVDLTKQIWAQEINFSSDTAVGENL